MSLSLHAYQDGVVALCETPAQRKEAFDKGMLPLATFENEASFSKIGRQFVEEVAGVWHLKAAMDRPLELDDLISIRAEIQKAQAAR